jgi:oligopeptide/dipeptide ABC transporter ATP-binding protein
MEPTSGRVFYRGRDVLTMGREDLLAFRKKAQIVFQDPFGSLNPRLRAGSVLEEVLKVHGGGSPPERKERVRELMSLVGLHPSHAGRYPHEFSGGQRQRLGIARALAVGPEILVLDEPVSALDLSVQAQILNLLQDLQDRLSLTLLLVAHDLSVVRHLADRVAVMYLGRLVEVSPVEELFVSPAHPYTRGLLAGADPAEPGPSRFDGWAPLPGDSPNPVAPPAGCAYHPRCPHPSKDRECELEEPDLGASRGARHFACWKESEGVD